MPGQIIVKMEVLPQITVYHFPVVVVHMPVRRLHMNDKSNQTSHAIQERLMNQQISESR